ncbi:MAG TPA: ATP-grasp domain-containing protein [Candidatus Fimousia stercorigallinarum]|nr:ATP-grasp domain-containing protein [Candidatus Fimousia stercorigallinarum]
MNFVFISPQFPDSYWNFCDRLKQRGVNVLGIGDSPYDSLSWQLKSCLTEYYRVDQMEDYDQMVRAMGYFTYKYGKIDWLESNNEYWLEQDAKLRADFNIQTGMMPEQVCIVRRKSTMKKYFEQAGVPVARYHMVSSYEQGIAFANTVGYPVFVKPDGGMGAEDSYKLSNEDDMRWFYSTKKDVPYIMEEFICGDIWSYDGISDSNGDIIFESCVSWPRSVADIVNNKDHLAYYTANMLPDDLREKGRATIKSFNVKSRFFHLEFFRLVEAKEGLGNVGDIVALEVNMRPAGGWTPDMYNFANSVDVYSIWADMVVYDKTYVDLTQQKYYAVYASQRYGKPYVHNFDDIRARYAGKIVLDEEIPEALSGAMGNHMWTAKLDTEEEKDEFIRFVQETY